MKLKKLEKFLGVNLLGLGPRLINEFPGPQCHRGWEALAYCTQHRIHHIYIAKQKSVPLYHLETRKHLKLGRKNSV
jgi:hypothetical protein